MNLRPIPLILWRGCEKLYGIVGYCKFIVCILKYDLDDKFHLRIQSLEFVRIMEAKFSSSLVNRLE